jgi:hypothetical protein
MPNDLTPEQDAAIHRKLLGDGQPTLPRDPQGLVEALRAAQGQMITMYTAIAQGVPDAGRRFAENDPAYVKVVAALAAWEAGK